MFKRVITYVYRLKNINTYNLHHIDLLTLKLVKKGFETNLHSSLVRQNWYQYTTTHEPYCNYV